MSLEQVASVLMCTCRQARTSGAAYQPTAEGRTAACWGSFLCGTDVAVFGSAAKAQSWVGRASLGPLGADGALQAHAGTYSLSGTCNLLNGSIVVGRPDLRMLRVLARCDAELAQPAQSKFNKRENCDAEYRSPCLL